MAASAFLTSGPLLGEGTGASIQHRLYDRVRAAVLDGRLQPGERLPSMRSLAAQLGIARGTIDAAYARLAGEGYVLGRGPAGTIVSPHLRAATGSAVAVASVPEDRRQVAPPLPFRGGLPALDLFPRTLWARLATRAVRQLSGAGLAYPDPAGLPALREAIAAYLAVSRGVTCRPAQVIVTGGYQSAVNLVAHLLLRRPGDAVWFEDPGYPLARHALEVASGGGGTRIVPVPVDADGIQVSHAQARCPDARLAVVTPAHQSPLGTALSMPRRQALLAWAEAADAWVLEDDYDSEFHYAGHKPPALKSLDRADRVLYAGSFSKTLFPSLRLGYLVLPAALVEPAVAACGVLHHGVGTFEQSVVAAFMTEGHFARHLRRMRTHYAARRRALAAELADQFGRQVEFQLQPGGLHLLARFPGHGCDVDLARRALDHGLAPTALSAQCIVRDPDRQGLLLGFTNIPETHAAEAVEKLRNAIGDAQLVDPKLSVPDAKRPQSFP